MASRARGTTTPAYERSRFSLSEHAFFFLPNIAGCLDAVGKWKIGSPKIVKVNSKKKLSNAIRKQDPALALGIFSDDSFVDTNAWEKVANMYRTAEKKVATSFQDEEKAGGGSIMEVAQLWFRTYWGEGRAYAANIWWRSISVHNPFVNTSAPCSAVPAPPTTTPRTPLSLSTPNRFVLSPSTSNPVPSSSWGHIRNTNYPAEATECPPGPVHTTAQRVCSSKNGDWRYGQAPQYAVHLPPSVIPRSRSRLSFQLSLRSGAGWGQCFH